MKLSTEIFNGLLEPLFKNKRMAVIVTFFLVFYGGAAGPKLPSNIIKLFESPIFRVFILSLIVYKGNSNPMLSLMIAVGFTLTMDMINKQKLFERFTKIEGFNGIEGFGEGSSYLTDNSKCFEKFKKEGKPKGNNETSNYIQEMCKYTCGGYLGDELSDCKALCNIIQKTDGKYCSNNVESFSGDISGNDLSIEGNYETFVDHDDSASMDMDLDMNQNDSLPIDGAPELPKFNEEELEQNLITYNFINSEQAQAIITKMKSVLEARNTVILDEIELSEVLDKDATATEPAYIASDNLDLGSIIQQLQNVQNEIESNSGEGSQTMMMDMGVYDEIDDEIYDELIDDELEPVYSDDIVSNIGF